MLKCNLKQILDARGISIRQLSIDIDYRFETVRLLVNNELERIPRELIYRICKHLNINISELFKIV